jgi:hypothetical protein
VSYFTLATFSGRAAATRLRKGPMVRIHLPPAVSPRTFGSGRGLPLGCGPTTQRVRGDIDDPSSSTTTYQF